MMLVAYTSVVPDPKAKLALFPVLSGFQAELCSLNFFNPSQPCIETETRLYSRFDKRRCTQRDGGEAEQACMWGRPWVRLHAERGRKGLRGGCHTKGSSDNIRRWSGGSDCLCAQVTPVVGRPMHARTETF